MTLVIDLQYFPEITLYKNVNNFSNIIFEQYEYYQKMSFRNRCRITGAGGIIDLSIPLEKGRDQKTLLKDVRIAGKGDWQGQHWKTLVSCYSRSPWFEFYRDELEQLYRKPFHFLLDWNLCCFEWSLGILQMPISFSLTSAYHKMYEEENWTDWRGRIRPKNRTLTGPLQGVGNPDPEVDPDASAGGGNNPSPDPGDPAGEAPIKYRQVFEERIGFQPNLSILDLLFCEGKNARSLLVTDAQRLK